MRVQFYLTTCRKKKNLLFIMIEGFLFYKKNYYEKFY